MSASTLTDQLAVSRDAGTLDDFKPLGLEVQQWVETQTWVPIFVLEWW